MKHAMLPALLLAAAATSCAPPPAAPPAGDGAVVASVTPRFNDLAGWLVQTVEQVPDSLYG